MDTSSDSDSDELVGTEYYMAPETRQGRYDFSTDLWSLGVLLKQLKCEA